MIIGHVRWVGLLANVWCSNLSEFSEKKYATRSFTLSVCSKCIENSLWRPVMGKTKEEEDHEGNYKHVIIH